MSDVAFAQLLFGAMAVLMLLEARRAGKRCDALRYAEHLDRSPDTPTELVVRRDDLHPELLAWWDDETDIRSAGACSRNPVSSMRTERRRSKPLVSNAR